MILIVKGANKGFNYNSKIVLFNIEKPSLWDGLGRDILDASLKAILFNASGVF